MQVLDAVFRVAKVIESFNGKFAKYDQGQELQADACSVRGMVSVGTDPLKAREEYLRKRGTEEAKNRDKPKQKSKSSRSFSLNYTEHPEDKDRDQFFREAYQHHRQKRQTADTR